MMRERIARAIHKILYTGNFDDIMPSARTADFIADAVLDAMREPTEEMVGECYNEQRDRGRTLTFIEVWQAMIDEVKK